MVEIVTPIRDVPKDRQVERLDGNPMLCWARKNVSSFTPVDNGYVFEETSRGETGWVSSSEVRNFIRID